MGIKKLTLNINGQDVQVKTPADEKLIWILREYEKHPIADGALLSDKGRLIGTKFGCGQGDCGICTVLLNGQSVKACLLPVQSCVGQKIMTVEGLADDDCVKLAWIKAEMNQCGYCQAGQLMHAKGFLNQNPNPTEAEVVTAMTPILCRCGTYHKIRKAICSLSNKCQS